MEGVEPLKAWMLDPLTQALSLVDRPRPEPGPQQVLIQVRAASLNRGEFLVGMAVAGGAAAPKPCGMEATGEVIAIGAEAATTLRFPLQIGSRVMGRSPGGFAQYALIEAQDLLPVPDQLSWFEAACIPIAYLVAYDMVVVGGDLKPGQSCLVTAVSSGVGVACLQMAQALGAHVIGTSSSDEKLDRLKSFGLQNAILSRGADFVDAVMAVTKGKGVELAINNVGGSVAEACLRSLAYQGRLALVGFVDAVKSVSMDLDRIHAYRLTIFGVSNKLRSAAQRAQSVRGFEEDILPMFAQGKLRPVIERVFAFEDLPAAQQAMRSNSHLGKLVLEVRA